METNGDGVAIVRQRLIDHVCKEAVAVNAASERLRPALESGDWERIGREIADSANHAAKFVALLLTLDSIIRSEGGAH